MEWCGVPPWLWVVEDAQGHIPAPAPTYLTHFLLYLLLFCVICIKGDNGRSSVHVSYLKLYLADNQKSSSVGLDVLGGIAVVS